MGRAKNRAPHSGAIYTKPEILTVGVKKMSMCKHYHENRQVFKSKEKFDTLDNLSTGKIIKVSYCDHVDSPHSKGEIGTLICEGNIDKCPI